MTDAQQPVKVLHIFGRMVRDGAEMRMLEMMRALDLERYRFHFCTLEGRPGDLDDEIRALGGVIHADRLSPGLPWRFGRLLREQRFDVVHSHVLLSSGFFLRLAVRERAPVRIAHFHSTGDGRPTTPRRRAQRAVMRRWVDRYATHLLGVSEGAMAAWNPWWRSDPRCQVVYDGIDVTPFARQSDYGAVRPEFNLPEECRLYIHVGRLAAPKNHERLIAVFAEIARTDPSAYLLVVGRGENDIERVLRARVATWGIADRVVFAGMRFDVPRLLTAADLLLFPSLREGLPGAVLEACAAGTPTLASDLPGVREIAARCPEGRYLSLEAGDKDWAATAMTLAADSRDPGRRDAIARAFAAGSLTIRDSVAAHTAIYQTRRALC